MVTTLRFLKSFRIVKVIRYKKIVILLFRSIIKKTILYKTQQINYLSKLKFL